MLMEAVQENHVLFFEHDPSAEGGTVRQESSGRIVLDKVGIVTELLLNS